MLTYYLIYNGNIYIFLHKYTLHTVHMMDGWMDGTNKTSFISGQRVSRVKETATQPLQQLRSGLT